jgi:predicted Ser/Thr protein kinase
MKINCKEIAREAKKIRVQKFEDEDVAVENSSSLEMIGKGRQGAVFKINEQACMKVYGEEEDCDREYYALSLGKKTDLLPKVYCKGKNFVVMEMVYGVDLREYLQSNPLTKELSHQLIQMLITFQKIGYERIDHHKRQIYLQEDGSLKVIDVGRTVWRNRTYPYPRKLLQSLGEEYKAVFLEHVKELAPELYNEWQHYMHLEEISRKVYQILEEKQKIDIDSLSKETETLLTTQDPKVHYNKLLGLVRKVVKEEREREKLQNSSKKQKIKDDKKEKIKSQQEENSEPIEMPKEKKGRVKIYIEESSEEQNIYRPYANRKRKEEKNKKVRSRREAAERKWYEI